MLRIPYFLLQCYVQYDVCILPVVDVVASSVLTANVGQGCRDSRLFDVYEVFYDIFMGCPAPVYRLDRTPGTGLTVMEASNNVSASCPTP